jgi:uncharacterized protein (DUF2141 family)
MKARALLLLLLIITGITLPSFHPVEDAGLKVAVTNLRNNKGHVLISLFKDGVGYPDKPEKAFRKVKVAVSNKTASIVFEGLPVGTYAVAILHDENNDEKLNTNLLGLPKEGYGFSNNVMGAFGPPAFSKASIKVSPKTVISTQIKTRY